MARLIRRNMAADHGCKEGSGSELRQSQGSGPQIETEDCFGGGAGPSGVSCCVLTELLQVSHAAPDDGG